MTHRPYCKACGGDRYRAVAVEVRVAGSHYAYLDESEDRRVPCDECDDGYQRPADLADAAEYASDVREGR